MSGKVIQLGQVNEADRPAWLPAEIPWPLDPSAPGLVSETECQRRELAAYEKGRADEGRSTIKVAAVSTAVSVLVAGAIGYALGR